MSEPEFLTYRAEGNKRFISGIAVPWDEPIRVMGQHESFTPGSVTIADNAPLRYGHQATTEGFPIPIGRITRSRDTPEGLWIEAELLPVATAEHAYQAVAAGIVRGFSMEFTSTTGRGQSGHGRVVNATCHGLALTEEPAYKDAKVLSHRTRRPVLEKWQRELARRSRVT